MIDCLLPNWKYAVGTYWHVIIPRRKKKTWLHIVIISIVIFFNYLTVIIFCNVKVSFLFDNAFLLFIAMKAISKV